jgi:glutathione S-transferase
MATTLFSEHFAPWCERARWALDHHRIPYSVAEHVPLIGDLRLRWASGRWRGPVTVPLLVDGTAVLMDSIAIARYADLRGSGPRLFPRDGAAEVSDWCRRIEPVMQRGRARVLAALLDNHEALAEAAPLAGVRPLRPLMAKLAAGAVRRLQRKYRAAARPDDDARIVRPVIRDLETAIGAGTYLVGGAFSFADIAAACAVQFILPVDPAHIRLGPASRRAWTWDAMIEASSPLIAWRDRIYDRHRSPPAAVSGEAP